MRYWQWVLGLALPLFVLAAAWLIEPDAKADIYPLTGNSLREAYFVPTTAAQTRIHLIVQAGERDNYGTEGIAHYVEHLAWLNAIGANKALTNRHTNAFTNALATEYVLSVPVENTEAAMKTLAKVFQPFSIDENFMLSERDIILREDEMRNAGPPVNDYVEKINKIGYVNDPLARSVMGSRADIAAFSLDEAKDWHRSTHRPEMTVLLIASPLPKKTIETMVSRVFSGPNRSFIPGAVTFYMGPAQMIKRRFTDDRFGQGIINFQKTVKMEPPLNLAAQLAQISLLHDILDSTLPGSYARPLRFDGGIAQSYELQLFAHSDRVYELSFLAMRPDAGVSLDALYQGLEAAVAGADIPQDSFDRVKDRWLKRAQQDDRAELAYGLARRAILRRVALVTPDDYLAAARAITLQDMNRLARAFAGPGRTIVDTISAQ